MKKPPDFEDLKAFILDRARMRMTHIYRPVMLQAVPDQHAEMDGNLRRAINVVGQRALAKELGVS